MRILIHESRFLTLEVILNQTGAHVNMDLSLILYLSEWILMMVAFYDF